MMFHGAMVTHGDHGDPPGDPTRQFLLTDYVVPRTPRTSPVIELGLWKRHVHDQNMYIYIYIKTQNISKLYDNDMKTT